MTSFFLRSFCRLLYVKTNGESVIVSHAILTTTVLVTNPHTRLKTFSLVNRSIDMNCVTIGLVAPERSIGSTMYRKNQSYDKTFKCFVTTFPGTVRPTKSTWYTHEQWVDVSCIPVSGCCCVFVSLFLHFSFSISQTLKIIVRLF